MTEKRISAPGKLTLLGKDEQQIGETYDCTFSWSAGPDGFTVDVTSPDAIKLPHEAAYHMELRSPTGELFAVVPLIGRPVQGGYELVLNR